MAKFEVGSGFFANFNTSGLYAPLDGVITIQNQFQIRFQFSGGYEDFLGSFQYHGQDLPTGTLQQFRVVVGGAVEYALTQASVNFNTLLKYAIAGNGGAVLSLFFAGNDTLIGAELNDSMSGFGGNDTMLGKAGNDRLNGMIGNDVLNGGPGDDVLIGGPGNDRFLFTGNFGNDRIADFSAGPAVGDVIQISHVLLPSVGYAKNHATLEAGHVVLHDTAGHSIALLTVHSVGALSTNDFLII